METPAVTEKNLAAIHTLDTAKMTLRWALERMRLLEEKNASLQRRFEESEANLRAHALAARGIAAVQAEETESHARKMQSLLAEHEKALADLRTLRAREGDVEQERLRLERKRSAMNEDFLHRNELLERRSRIAQEELRARDIRRESSVEEDLVGRRMELDGEYVSRELALRSAQRQLAEREMALMEMEARLEDRLREGKQRLETDTLRLRGELREEAERRLSEWEDRRKDLKAFETRKESVERATLAEQARLWEALAREGLAKIETLERAQSEARETLLRQAAELKEPRALRLEIESLQARVGELGGSLQAAEERVRSLQIELQGERIRCEDKIAAGRDELRAKEVELDARRTRQRLELEESRRRLEGELELGRRAQEEAWKEAEALRQERWTRRGEELDSFHAKREGELDARRTRQRLELEESRRHLEEELERRQTEEANLARDRSGRNDKDRRALEILEAELGAREESLRRAEAELREYEERLLALWTGKQEELASLREGLVQEIAEALAGRTEAP